MQFQYQKYFFLIIQFSTSTVSFYLTLSGVTTPGQVGHGSDRNKGVLHIPQRPSITRTSPSDCLVSYPGLSLGGSYPSVEVQSVYSTAPADWAMHRVNVKAVLFQTIQFSISTQFRCQNSSISNKSV